MEYGRNPDRQCKGLEKRIRVRYGEVFWIRLKGHGHASGIKKVTFAQKTVSQGFALSNRHRF